jgi:hypothetical protein
LTYAPRCHLLSSDLVSGRISEWRISVAAIICSPGYGSGCIRRTISSPLSRDFESKTHKRRKWSSKPNVLDIAPAQGDNWFVVKPTNVSGDWSLSLKLTDLGGNAIPDVTYSAP